MDVEDFLSAAREFWLEGTRSPEDLGLFPKLVSPPVIAPSQCENQRKGVETKKTWSLMAECITGLPACKCCLQVTGEEGSVCVPFSSSLEVLCKTVRSELWVWGFLAGALWTG